MKSQYYDNVMLLICSECVERLIKIFCNKITVIEGQGIDSHCLSTKSGQSTDGMVLVPLSAETCYSLATSVIACQKILIKL